MERATGVNQFSEIFRFFSKIFRFEDQEDAQLTNSTDKKIVNLGQLLVTPMKYKTEAGKSDPITNGECLSTSKIAEKYSFEVLYATDTGKLTTVDSELKTFKKDGQKYALNYLDHGTILQLDHVKKVVKTIGSENIKLIRLMGCSTNDNAKELSKDLEGMPVVGTNQKISLANGNEVTKYPGLQKTNYIGILGTSKDQQNFSNNSQVWGTVNDTKVIFDTQVNVTEYYNEEEVNTYDLEKALLNK